ncbi:MAG TPA: bacitracin ABC transporter ATP-binding protein [Cyanobacteria bacterium UBA11149]|nr:bacitracin ABC transporter ATP-binding protein [Cyanobacteria bacterium UBA11367]HBE59262.1 bacitracin ABC transporter ATP-binding protein [Cyanobacteria bacterium UBA11366]HBK64931.1 bacitracin ABC transporter ATP-binding protein [Cyanobacteria bacterium UBA11166]HBR74670.1 bacitracin ABC transporter ATP-binding protein [Cyanobacteria bacterium UBA11159]HBS71496.1 bacitracin ABC transporter ATP-binding protein [Cyanobacteria bacterium UBA11153]HBW89632.1 bacitracin ABC transporter ATP-bind
MSVFVEVDHIDRVFPLANGGEYIALKNIELKIKQGEFISLIGHSGCGKSTLLNIIAGLDQPSHGGVILEGRQVTKPGPDRMVVFQNYSLLPWLTVKENIALAVDEVYPNKPKGERKGIVEHHIDLVGLRLAAKKRPTELSGGMKQRVAIARALAIRPKLLLLDEPFGALDALTRGGLQEQLMKICEESQLTCVMVTHDVDEALLLSDRIIMLTNGPESHIGQILEVEIPRPRQRLEVVNHPSYYSYRNEIIYFLNQQKKDKLRKAGKIQPIARHGLEKINLEIGFIPLTDCAPLIVAKEKGFFEKHGLEEVTLNREPSWQAIAKGIVSGRLDAAAMVSGMPLSLTLGAGNKPKVPIVSALTLSRNGNAITLNKRLYDLGVRTPVDFKEEIQNTPDKVHTLGMVYPSSMQNLILRYWLASGGIDPDNDVSLAVIPPPQMVSNLKAGNIDGYCVGEPWNSRAINEELGVVVATDLDIFPSHIEKVLGVREDWAIQHPQTHLALVKALLEACEYCDDWRNREEIAALLAQDQYVGAAPENLRPGFIDPYNRGTRNEGEIIQRYNQFFVDKTNCPDRVEALWMMTQLSRWGIIPFPKNWVTISERVWRTDIFGQAARELDLPDMERERMPLSLFDGKIFDPDEPVKYLKSLEIKRKIEVEEIDIDSVITSAA